MKVTSKKESQQFLEGLEIETKPEPTQDEVLLWFPIVGIKLKTRTKTKKIRAPLEKQWALTASKVHEYEDAFPAVAILAECKRARQWCIDNPTRRKTEKGMTPFLNKWLSKQQDNPRVQNQGATFNGNGHQKNNYNGARQDIFTDCEETRLGRR